MTNEERAKEIANETLGDFATSFLGMIDEYSEMFCTEAAFRAAEWKDQQFKEYLENKRKELIHKRYNEIAKSPYDFGNLEGQIDAISLIIKNFSRRK